jgi:phospholipid/cholesterol/gamma-HCH transport system ATP-binding protein
MTDPQAVVSVRNLHTRYGKVWILRDLDLAVARGEMVALVGASGSGKTTLLRHLIGLKAPTQGEVRIFDEPLFGGDAIRQQVLRRRFGVLFQNGALFSAFSVFDNVAFPLRETRLFNEATIAALVRLKLDMVELLPRHGALMPAELSGGMVKRVALARALALDPELLLLDEPTAGLDPDRALSFVKLIRMLGDELALTVVLATHDLGTLSALSTQVAVLAEQRILAYAPLAQVMQIEHPFIQKFFVGASVQG